MFIGQITVALVVILIGLSNGRSLRGKTRDATVEDNLSFVVSIGRTGQSNSHFCTGTLITAQSVLTAAHCLLDENFEGVQMTIGSRHLSEGRKYRVATWQSFDQWYYRTPKVVPSVDDIAIITLTEKVHHNIKPAKVLFTSVQSLHCSKVRLAGWGLIENGTRPMILQTGIAKVVPLNECIEKAKEIKGEDYRVPDEYFCSKAEPYVLADCGDSGGPLLNRANQLIAINRGGCPLLNDHPREFANNNQMNLHLQLLPYMNFINAFQIQ